MELSFNGKCAPGSACGRSMGQSVWHAPVLHCGAVYTRKEEQGPNSQDRFCRLTFFRTQLFRLQLGTTFWLHEISCVSPAPKLAHGAGVPWFMGLSTSSRSTSTLRRMADAGRNPFLLVTAEPRSNRSIRIAAWAGSMQTSARGLSGHGKPGRRRRRAD